MSQIVEAKGLTKVYRSGALEVQALRGIDFQARRGEFIVILGPSGSGKSTLLNIVGILDNYDTGEYYLDGKLIKDLTERQAAQYRNRMIGFVFQSFNAPCVGKPNTSLPYLIRSERDFQSVTSSYLAGLPKRRPC